MTLDEFFAEAKRIGLTAEVFAAQLAGRPEFADCLPLASHTGEAEPVRVGRIDVHAGKVKSFAFEQTDIADGEYALYVAAAATPAAPGEVTDAQLLDLADDFKSTYQHGGTTFDDFDSTGFARAVLALSHPAPMAASASVPQAIDQLVSALAESKGWMRDYARGVIEDAIDRRHLEAAEPAPASEAAKLDYVTRSLRAIADRGRAELGDSYAEIVSLWATVRDLHRGDSADAPVQQAGEAEPTRDDNELASDFEHRLNAWHKDRAALKGEQPEPSGSEREEVK